MRSHVISFSSWIRSGSAWVVPHSSAKSPPRSPTNPPALGSNDSMACIAEAACGPAGAVAHALTMGRILEISCDNIEILDLAIWPEGSSFVGAGEGSVTGVVTGPPDSTSSVDVVPSAWTIVVVTTVTWLVDKGGQIVILGNAAVLLMPESEGVMVVADPVAPSDRLIVLVRIVV